MKVVVATINYNTAPATLRCVESLMAGIGIEGVFLLDNASAKDDVAILTGGLENLTADVRLMQAGHNIGFAAGMNLLVEQIMVDSGVDAVLLLNNDAIALPGFANNLTAVLGQSPETGMVGGRVHRMSAPDQPDSLGIAMYSSLIASNRLAVVDPYLGPTGACMLMSRDFICDVIASTGHLFDPDFFCYWEDTDLVLRARLLGYEPAYVDTLLALHEGQASTGGRFNTFIAYHGLRNAIWTFVKCMPLAVIIRRAPHFFLANLMSIARFMATGEWRLLYRIYRDAMLGLPRCWRQRRRIMAAKRIQGGRLMDVISDKFYETGYVAAAIRRIFSGKRNKPGRGS